MKILHFLGRKRLAFEPYDVGTGGTPRVAVEMAIAQSRRGHEVWVATTARESWEREWKGIHLTALNLFSGPVTGALNHMDLCVHLPLMKFCHKHRFDIIHGHDYPYLRFLRAKLRIAHVHNNPFWSEDLPDQWRFQVREFRTLNRHSDIRIAVSQYVARQLDKGTAVLCGSRSKQYSTTTRVVRNGVDRARFMEARQSGAGLNLRESWGFGDRDVVFMYAGAITRQKGVMNLARAFSDVLSRVPSARLVVAGGAALWGNAFHSGRPEDMRYESDVAATLEPLVRRKVVRFLGVVPASEMPAVFAASDVFVLPSMQEACCLVILEALSSGLPVIASGDGGTPEITNPASSILVRPDDPEDLASAMEKLTHHDLRTRLADQAPLAVRDQTWDRAAESLEEIYAEFPARRLDAGSFPGLSPSRNEL